MATEKQHRTYAIVAVCVFLFFAYLGLAHEHETGTRTGAGYLAMGLIIAGPVLAFVWDKFDEWKARD